MVQIANSEMVNSLSAFFARRNEPNVAWGNAISMFSMLPGLRGFWPMSSYNESGNAYDLSGQDRILTYAGNPKYSNSGLAPCLILDGTGDYLSRADEAGFDIVGTEAFTLYPGLTLGGWYKFDTLARAEEIVTKWTSIGSQKSYMLQKTVGNVLNFSMTTDGSTLKVVNSTVAAYKDIWLWWVGRFTPSAELAVWINLTKTVNTTAIPASIHSGTAAFYIGLGETAAMDGSLSLQFICASALPDYIIKALFHHSRALFGI